LGVFAVFCSQRAAEWNAKGRPRDWPHDDSEDYGDRGTGNYLKAQARRAARGRGDGLQTIVNVLLGAATIATPVALLPWDLARLIAPLFIAAMAICFSLKIRAKYVFEARCEDAWGVWLAFSDGKSRYGESHAEYRARFTAAHPKEERLLARAGLLHEPPAPELLAPHM
jgi:hypothetical protein